MPELLVASGGDRRHPFGEPPREWSGNLIQNPVSHLPDREKFGRRAGEKDLIRLIERPPGSGVR